LLNHHLVWRLEVKLLRNDKRLSVDVGALLQHLVPVLLVTGMLVEDVKILSEAGYDESHVKLSQYLFTKGTNKQ